MRRHYKILLFATSDFIKPKTRLHKQNTGTNPLYGEKPEHWDTALIYTYKGFVPVFLSIEVVLPAKSCPPPQKYGGFNIFR
jgi:hypothetical protein